MSPAYRLKQEPAPKESASLRAEAPASKPKAVRKPAEKKVRPPSVKGKAPDIASGIQNKALSIRQPYAEMILRGIKKIEYRSMPTNIRGRVYIYASLTPGEEEDFESLKAKAGDFPTGVLVGTVEIVGCEKPLFADNYHWQLANPKRLETPITADNRAQPSWFIPFRKE